MSHRDTPWKRTYLRRQGKATKAQKRALRELWDDYGVTFAYGERVSPAALLGGPVVLDVGFGLGESLGGLAGTGLGVFGLEVHQPGIGAALMRLDAAGLAGVRVARGDALWALRDHLDGPFEAVYVGFPDPWHTHPERRIVGPWLLDLLATRLRPGGVLHVATDVVAYAEHVRALVAEHPDWTLESEDRPPWRVPSKYELKGLSEGRRSTDLRIRFRDGPPCGLPG